MLFEQLNIMVADCLKDVNAVQHNVRKYSFCARMHVYNQHLEQFTIFSS